ncbi:adenylosuccinate lyase [Candidatus Nitromaritima sp. SCGC AAA799-A02]|nr:adenylosuccinate lyase [Candidatus Nitromaritima sp. SCGC AAA799-C22]KMP10623.1 adenylosuccinate lyase [Candidatus Nitromaritima sp. SCGC AAA799-A02]
MIPRYTLPELARIWEPENKFNIWLKIEILVCEALARRKEIPASAVAEIKKKAKFDIARIDEIEKEVKHDVIAFLTCVSENVGEANRYMHLGLTSSDILDTTLAVQLKESATRILKELEAFRDAVRVQALRYKDTPMIGRSHGIHAEPLTFGLKLAVWYGETCRNIERMKRARDCIAYGQISGAVGTFANIDPAVEEYVCKKLGLKPAPVSTQIVQRDRHAEFFTTLAIVAGSIDKFATEIRHLQRTEVLEVEEFFSSGQKGSSAMPHKRNPIVSEQMSGLARVVRANALAAMENVPLWHERDISHSSVERVIGPDSTILAHYMLRRMTALVAKMIVYPKNMKKNLELTGGLCFSQSVLLALVRKGVTREDAYSLVQRNAMRAWEGRGAFLSLLKKDGAIKKHLSGKELDKVFNMKDQLKNVDKIFNRVFNNKK